MYKGLKILAIIPARSGSKGLPDKNIKQLAGKPMIAHTIEAAVESEIFDDILVSTDSEKYAEIARKYGASCPFLRPCELSTDEATSTDVILYTINRLKQMGREYDCFMLLQPTSPLRMKTDIAAATDLLIEKEANAIVSVCEVEHSPLLTNTLDQTLSMDTFFDSDAWTMRRQDLPSYYRLNGAIYLAKVNYFLNYKNFYYNKCHAYIMDQKHSIDIDNEVDFKFAQLLLDTK
ncbi:cytidylyltransferase domain-containing protein [Gracilibacillus marinus]|uniref:Cytidylyltransferase domain-containing protein n=1 Tax=Gracilibacillus marinus TaxID=630535 RepID=A0ABV8VTQ2_9BACI